MRKQVQCLPLKYSGVEVESWMKLKKSQVHIPQIVVLGLFNNSFWVHVGYLVTSYYIKCILGLSEKSLVICSNATSINVLQLAISLFIFFLILLVL